MMDDDRIFRAAKADVAIDGLSPELRLMYLIARQTGDDGLTGQQWEELCEEAVEAAGSVGAAIEAFESGRITLEKHEQ